MRDPNKAYDVVMTVSTPLLHQMLHLPDDVRIVDVCGYDFEGDVAWVDIKLDGDRFEHEPGVIPRVDVWYDTVKQETSFTYRER